MFIVLFVLKTLVSKMCMHPTVDKNLSKLYNKYENVVLDEFDNCDYIHKILDADCKRLGCYATKYLRYRFKKKSIDQLDGL